MWSGCAQRIQKFGAKSAGAVALFLTWFLYLTVVDRAHLWYWVGVGHMSVDVPYMPYFADLYALLSAADCKNLGYDVFRANPCDLWQRVHVYPSIWLWLGKMGLGRPDVLWLGVGIDIAFAILVVRLINPRGPWEFIVGTLVVLSPAVSLAMERCNNDLIIFCVLSCAALLASSRNRFPYYLGIITSFFATALKIYPVITMPTATLMADSKRRLATAAAITSLLIISWLLLSADELSGLRHTIPRPEGPLASGGTLLLKYLGIKWHMFFLSLGLALIMLTIAIRLAMELDVKATIVAAHRPFVSHYYFGLSVMSFTFLTTINFDYRWIFSIFSLPWLFLLKRDTGNNRGIRHVVMLCVVLMIVVTWSEALIGDVPRFPRWLSYLAHVLSIVAPGHGDTTEIVVRWLGVGKQLSAWSLLTVLAAIGIKTFMVEGTYVSAMFEHFVRRTFGLVATRVRLR
jgi:hypothetical protein